jgi:hypothetical protein
MERGGGGFLPEIEDEKRERKRECFGFQQTHEKTVVFKNLIFERHFD